MIVIVMGVSGAGKTAVGSELARRLDCAFLDADDYHPPQNVAKMAAGAALEDADRWPWLERLNALLRERESAVLACSALKQQYRDRLADGLECCKIVFLPGDQALIRARLEQREHRYMPASLLASQFAALEPPADAIAVDVAADLPACIAAIERALGG
jgi:gluconokinase